MSKGGTEAKAAMSELINELDRTRKEYAKSAMHATQLETQLHTTRDELIDKDQRIQSLNAELTDREERHRQQVHILEETFQSKEAAWHHRIKTLEIEVQRLQTENANMILMERENRQLRDTILENQAVVERLQAINDDLRNKARDESRDQTAFLEAEFKKRLADAEKKFRAEAYRALSEEAKLALQGNDHLQTVLQRQNDSIEAVLLRCKTLEQSHTKIQEEQEANIQSAQAQVAEIQRLKKQLAEAKSKGSLMDDALKQRRVERASLELLFVEYETTRKQLANAREKLRRSQREADRWKNRAIQLTKELDDEQREAAETKLATMQAQSDTIEEHLEKKRQRDIRRAMVKKANSDGAAAIRQAEAFGEGPWSDEDRVGSDAAAWEGVSDGEEESSLRAGGQNHLKHRSIDPMEILAIWNVNFESWRPPPLDDGDERAGPVGRRASSHSPSVAPSSATASPPQLPKSPTVEGEGLSAQPPQAAISTSGGGAVHSQHPTPPAGGARSQQLTVSERQQFMDQKLSVLAQPKSSLPPGARYYVKGGRRPLDLPPSATSTRSSMPPLQELHTVSHGEFKVAKRNAGGSSGSTDGSNRFLVP